MFRALKTVELCMFGLRGLLLLLKYTVPKISNINKIGMCKKIPPKTLFRKCLLTHVWLAAALNCLVYLCPLAGRKAISCCIVLLFSLFISLRISRAMMRAMFLCDSIAFHSILYATVFFIQIQDFYSFRTENPVAYLGNANDSCVLLSL